MKHPLSFFIKHTAFCSIRFLPIVLLSAMLSIAASAADITLTPHAGVLKDGKETTYAAVSELTVSGDALHALYLVFDRPVGTFDLSADSGERKSVNEHNYLHLFLDLTELFGSPQSRVTLHLDKASLSEIQAFGDEPIPDSVQRWEPPHEKADMMLFSAHSDDEHLFFAGIIPLYAGERGLDLQVVYLTNNSDTHNRPHELLNGLWTAGLRHYPVIGPFPDLYSESLPEAERVYRGRGYEESDFLAFEVEMLRRFKPSVVISHDKDGEYGHGTHILLSTTLQKAVKMAADTELFPESEVQYGAWEPFKLYLHLWKDDPIVLDWDVPLASFGGKTAFEVSKESYACHASQQWTWFTRWVKVPTAADIKTYSPKEYGLVFSSVGKDVLKNDFFENLTSNRQYEEAERLSASLSAAESSTESTATPSETQPSAVKPDIAEASAATAVTDSSASSEAVESVFGTLDMKDYRNELQNQKDETPLPLISLILSAAAAVILLLLLIRINTANKTKNHNDE